MKTKFRHVALIGKYQAFATGLSGDTARLALGDIAAFLAKQGCHVSVESGTAASTGLAQYPSLAVEEIGLQ